MQIGVSNIIFQSLSTLEEFITVKQLQLRNESNIFLFLHKFKMNNIIMQH